MGIMLLFGMKAPRQNNVGGGAIEPAEAPSVANTFLILRRPYRFHGSPYVGRPIMPKWSNRLMDGNAGRRRNTFRIIIAVARADFSPLAFGANAYLVVLSLLEIKSEHIGVIRQELAFRCGVLAIFWTN